MTGDTHDRRPTARVLVSNTTWNALGQLVPVALNIGMTPYFIHHLGVDRWGLIALVTTIESILASFDGGLTQTTTRYFAIYAGADDRGRTTRTLVSVLVFVVTAGVVVGVAGWFVSPPLVGLFAMPGRFRPETVFYLRTVVALIALGFARNAIASVVTARQRYAVISGLNLTTYVIWVVGLVVTIQGGWGLRGVAVTFLAQQAAATLIVIPVAWPYLDRSSLGPLPRREARALFTYSSKVQVSGLSQLANAEFDSVLIGTALSVHSLAMYSAGYGLITQVNGLFANALLPAGTHLGQVLGRDGPDAARRLFERMQRGWVIAVNACYAVALGAAYYAVVDWLGRGFGVAGAIATIMVASQGVLALATMLGIYCVTIGHAGIEMRVGLVAVVVNVVLTAGLVFVGVIGVVVATVVAWLVACWYGLRRARRLVDPDLPGFVEDLSLPATVITAGAVLALEYLLHPHVPAGPLGLIAAGGPCLVGLVLFAVVRAGPRRTAAMARQAVSLGPSGLRALIGRVLAAPITQAGRGEGGSGVDIPAEESPAGGEVAYGSGPAGSGPPAEVLVQ